MVCFTVEAEWTDRRLDTHYGGGVLLDGHLYGSTHKSHRWACLEWETGRLGCEAEGLDKGSAAAADGMRCCCGESGALALVRPSPKRVDVVSSFKIRRGTVQHWAHPMICEGRLYIRHGDTLVAFDLTAGRQASRSP